MIYNEIVQTYSKKNHSYSKKTILSLFTFHQLLNNILNDIYIFILNEVRLLNQN